ncbi:hypothetical protein L1987_03476 [Smallanthus sonchifolius]|uniref:Uncharacterized protein n=1 Tax=Smallanthus sonchifolius TaxID=185202 RepID=A0ACB9KAP4_9ASTR|nr:hypothetical protein L1987_03476 [Smallanthus sonchifolius]
MFLSLLFLWFHVLIFTATAAEFQTNYCELTTSNNTINPSFYSNLIKVLDSLASDTTINYNWFLNKSAGSIQPDIAYGLYLCRADLLPNDCRNCLLEARKNITNTCPLSKVAVSWSDNCMLRYANYSMVSVMNSETFIDECNKVNVSGQVSEQNRFWQDSMNLMGRLAKQASTNRKELIAYDEFSYNETETIYGYVQCTPDLSGSDCNRCLKVSIDRLSQYCHGREGARVLAASCNVRFEIYKFLKFSTASSEKQGKKKIPSKIIAAIVAIVGFLVIAMATCFLFLVKKPFRPITSGELKDETDIDESGIITEQSIQFELGTIEDATNNFSIENKVGEGGFGVVYKAWSKWENGDAVEILDSNMVDSSSENEAVRCINIALLCVQEDDELRPSMASVILMLNSNSFALPAPQKPPFVSRKRVGYMTSGLMESDKSLSTVVADASLISDRSQDHKGINSATAAEFRTHYCELNTTSNTNNTSFYSNLVQVLDSFALDYATINDKRFLSKSTGSIQPDIAYVLYLCRADVLPNDCLNCLLNAREDIKKTGPFSKAAVSWSDNCVLRYANYSVVSMMNSDTFIPECNKVNISDVVSEQSQFWQNGMRFMGELASRASNDMKEMFAYDELSYNGEKIHGYVECTPDLSGYACDQCLQFSIASSEKPGKKKIPSTIITAIVVIVGFLVVTAAIYFLFLVKKWFGPITSRDLKDETCLNTDDIGMITEQSLQFEWGKIEEATDNFSIQYIVGGEGGFGVVYKVRNFPQNL